MGKDTQLAPSRAPKTDVETIPVDRPRFHSVTSDTLPRRVSRELIVGILRGSLKPGDELPPEEKLATEFDVSRPVIREALKHLVVLGLVRSRQGRQSRVAPYEAWNHFAPEILAARRDAGVVEDVLLELLELRRMIEVQAAAAAATRATKEDLQAMKRALADLNASLADPPRYAQADIAFHDAILRATKNHLLPSLFEIVRPLLEFAREISLATRPQGPQVSQVGHQAIFEAIRTGSPADARRHMEEHLSWTANLDFNERDVRLALEQARRDSFSGSLESG